MLEAIYIFGVFYAVLLSAYGIYFIYDKKINISLSNKAFYLTSLTQVLFLAGSSLFFLTNTHSALSIFIGSILASAGLGIKFLSLKEWSKKKTGILKSGVYSRIRHPMYTGNMLVYFGLSMIASVYGLVLLCFVIPAFIIRGRIEEKYMEKNTDYSDYKKKVPAFMPAIY